MQASQPSALDMSGVGDFLKSIDLFSRMGAKQLSQLALTTTVVSYTPHMRIVKAGNPVDRILVVQEGSLVVVNQAAAPQGPSPGRFQQKKVFRERQQQHVALLGPGAVLGVKALISGGGYPNTILSESNCSLLVMKVREG